MRLLWILSALLLTAAQDPARAGRTALTKALKDRHTEGVQEALGQLVKANNDTALKAIATALPKLKDLDEPWTVETYWSLLGAAASFADSKAVDELANFIPPGFDLRPVFSHDPHALVLLEVCCWLGLVRFSSRDGAADVRLSGS